MKKKYQVFVSSTYEDLREERQKVIKALLHMGCFPVGMEYFNASDSDQWNTIQSLIDECDYYILILAGRYGSVDKESKLSYTEKEYRYALQKGLPVLCFVYHDIDQLQGGKIEKNSNKRKLLEKFRSEVLNSKLCSLWHSSDELVPKVVLSLNDIIYKNPRPGWTRNEHTENTLVKANQDITLSYEFNFDQINKKILLSNEVYIFGLGCTITVKLLYDILIKKDSFPNKLKFLLMTPDQIAVQLAAKREGVNVTDVSQRYVANLSLIEELNKKFPGNIDYRTIDYLPPYNMFIFNPQESSGEILVHLSGWKAASSNERLLLYISKNNNQKYFDGFMEEFKALWKASIETD